jgi:hypothetical protein
MKRALLLVMLSFMSAVVFADVSSTTSLSSRATPLEVLRTREVVYSGDNSAVSVPSWIVQKGSINAARNGPDPSTFYPGSLKANIERIAARKGWAQVVWQPRYDYQWTGKTRFEGDFPEMLSQVLRNYPLQAVFYQGNHVLVITPRNLYDEKASS